MAHSSRVKHSSSDKRSFQFDSYTVMMDILHQWVTILCVVLSAGLLCYSYECYRYSPVYETKATMVVRNGDINSTVYTNIRSAVDTANIMTQVINSNTFQKIVAQEAGLDGFSGTASASAIENTNLITLKVDASSPELSFRQMKAIMNNYGSVADKVMDGIILETVENPQIPTGPTNPTHFIRDAVETMLVSLVLILLLMTVISSGKDTIRTEEDIHNKLMTHCLATVMYEKKYKTAKAKNRKKGILITDPTVSFRYVETMHRLARRVIERMDQKKAKVLMITSVAENEGKTTVVVNLALAMTQEHKRVLLIDGDFRKPSVYLVTGFKNKEFTTLSQAMQGKGSKDLFIKVPGSELRCILNRERLQNSAELIASDRMKNLIKYLRESYDYILIDTSPMAAASDAEEFVKIADASMIVVRQHVCESRNINDAIDVINGSRSDQVIGCVFNNVHGQLSRSWRGYHSYGRYGHYGQYGQYGKYARGGQNGGRISDEK